MKRVELRSIYNYIERLKPKNVALISQTVDRDIAYGDHKEDFTRKLRGREDVLAMELAEMGIHYEQPLPLVKPKKRDWRSFDMCIFAGELCYQSLASAGRLKKAGIKGTMFIEITEEEASSEAKLKTILTTAERYDAVDMLDRLVYLTKTARDPKFIDFDTTRTLTSEVSLDPHPEFTEALIDRRQPTLTPVASDFDDPPVERIAALIYRRLRDTELARKVKQLHDYRCQICDHIITLRDGSRYAEAHHIKPLGLSNGGPDEIENILCLCPNHHAELDYGACTISLELFRAHPAHPINQTFIDYHNQVIYAARL